VIAARGHQARDRHCSTAAGSGSAAHAKRGLRHGHRRITEHQAGKVVGSGSHRGDVEASKVGGVVAFLDGGSGEFPNLWERKRVVRQLPIRS
jgi:hypothetical protein